jgi:putative ABC transport system ATP-binding protein
MGDYISIRDLEFSYPDNQFQLSVKTLQVKRGERVAVVGPSGSGKTTLLNLIAGIVLPDTGRVEVGGQPVMAMQESKRRKFRIRHIGLVFQDFELIEYLTVLENILLVDYLEKPQAVMRVERAKSLAEKAGLSGNFYRYPHQLSQGEKQRVAICRALLNEPSLLLADEPTGNLDAHNKDNVMSILLDFAASHDSTLITVTHDPNLLHLFDRVIDFNELIAAREDGE